MHIDGSGKLLLLEGDAVPLRTDYPVPDANSANPFERAAAQAISGREKKPDLEDIDTIAAIDEKFASQIAVDFIAGEYNVDVSRITTDTPELMIFNPAVLRRAGPNNTLVWNIRTRSKGDIAAINEFVMVDAHTGTVVHREKRNHDINHKDGYG